MNIMYPSESIRAITEFLFIETQYEKIQPSDLVLVLGNDMIDGTMMEVNKLLLDNKIRADAKHSLWSNRVVKCRERK